MNTIINIVKDESFIVMWIAALSLAEIFKDILPLYKIDKTSITTKLKEVISKDEWTILTYELELLNLY